jgi:hypothetical protein
MTTVTLGTIIYGFFIDYLAGQKGLRPTSIRSYRDAVRLFLAFVSADARRPISQLQIEDLTFERVLGFLQHLETTRHNHVATRNQPLAGLRTFFEYVGRRLPEMLHSVSAWRQFQRSGRRCRRRDSWTGTRSRPSSPGCHAKVGRRIGTTRCC